MHRQTTLESKSVDQLKLLWKVLPHPTPEHVVRLFSRTKDGQKRVGDYARSLPELRRFVKSSEGKNVYVSPNPTCSTVGSRHSTADVTHWSFFLVDIDPMKDAVEPNPLNALEFALIYLTSWWGIDFTESSPMRPLIIDSGRGAQAWIRLGLNDLDDGPINRKQARKAMGYWLTRLNSSLGQNSECQVDTSTSDLPRLMRCPGTINQKTGRESRIINMGPLLYEGLAQKMVDETPPNIFVEPEVQDTVPGKTWQDAYQELTRTAQEYLLKGMEEGGRHKAVFSTAKKLSEVGVSMDEARKGIRRANKLRGKQHQLPKSEIENALKQAYGEA